MASPGALDVAKGWWLFLIDVEFARHYNGPHAIESGGLAARNPVLESLLPSLLFIRLGAFLDEVLEEYIDRNGMVMPKKFRQDFNGRIAFLGDQGNLLEPTKIHDIRLKRNSLAHESTDQCSMADLDAAIDTSNAELQHLGFVGPRPKFEMFAERNPRHQPESGYVFSHDYTFGIKQNGKVVAELKWSKHLGGPGNT